MKGRRVGGGERSGVEMEVAPGKIGVPVSQSRGKK